MGVSASQPRRLRASSGPIHVSHAHSWQELHQGKTPARQMYDLLRSHGLPASPIKRQGSGMHMMALQAEVKESRCIVALVREEFIDEVIRASNQEAMGLIPSSRCYAELRWAVQWDKPVVAVLWPGTRAVDQSVLRDFSPSVRPAFQDCTPLEWVEEGEESLVFAKRLVEYLGGTYSGIIPAAMHLTSVGLEHLVCCSTVELNHFITQDLVKSSDEDFEDAGVSLTEEDAEKLAQLRRTARPGDWGPIQPTAVVSLAPNGGVQELSNGQEVLGTEFHDPKRVVSVQPVTDTSIDLKSIRPFSGNWIGKPELAADSRVSSVSSGSRVQFAASTYAPTEVDSATVNNLVTAASVAFSGGEGLTPINTAGAIRRTVSGSSLGSARVSRATSLAASMQSTPQSSKYHSTAESVVLDVEFVDLSDSDTEGDEAVYPATVSAIGDVAVASSEVSESSMENGLVHHEASALPEPSLSMPLSQQPVIRPASASTLSMLASSPGSPRAAVSDDGSLTSIPAYNGSNSFSAPTRLMGFVRSFSRRLSGGQAPTLPISSGHQKSRLSSSDSVASRQNSETSVRTLRMQVHPSASSDGSDSPREQDQMPYVSSSTDGAASLLQPDSALYTVKREALPSAGNSGLASPRQQSRPASRFSSVDGVASHQNHESGLNAIQREEAGPFAVGKSLGSPRSSLPTSPCTPARACSKPTSNRDSVSLRDKEPVPQTSSHSPSWPSSEVNPGVPTAQLHSPGRPLPPQVSRNAPPAMPAHLLSRGPRSLNQSLPPTPPYSSRASTPRSSQPTPLHSAPHSRSSTPLDPELRSLASYEGLSALSQPSSSAALQVEPPAPSRNPANLRHPFYSVLPGENNLPPSTPTPQVSGIHAGASQLFVTSPVSSPEGSRFSNSSPSLSPVVPRHSDQPEHSEPEDQPLGYESFPDNPTAAAPTTTMPAQTAGGSSHSEEVAVPDRTARPSADTHPTGTSAGDGIHVARTLVPVPPPSGSKPKLAHNTRGVRGRVRDPEWAAYMVMNESGEVIKGHPDSTAAAAPRPDTAATAAMVAQPPRTGAFEALQAYYSPAAALPSGEHSAPPQDSPARPQRTGATEEGDVFVVEMDTEERGEDLELSSLASSCRYSEDGSTAEDHLCAAELQEEVGIVRNLEIDDGMQESDSYSEDVASSCDTSEAEPASDGAPPDLPAFQEPSAAETLQQAYPEQVLDNVKEAHATSKSVEMEGQLPSTLRETPQDAVTGATGGGLGIVELAKNLLNPTSSKDAASKLEMLSSMETCREQMVSKGVFRNLLVAIEAEDLDVAKPVLSTVERIMMDSHCQSLIDAEQTAQFFVRTTMHHVEAVGAGQSTPERNMVAQAVLSVTRSMLHTFERSSAAALADADATSALCRSLQSPVDDDGAWDRAVIGIIASLTADTSPVAAHFQQRLLDLPHGVASVVGLIPQEFMQPSSPATTQSKTELETICGALQVLTNVVDRPYCPPETVRTVLDTGVLPKIISIADAVARPAAVPVQAAAVKLLGALSAHSESTRQELVNAGAIPHLVRLLGSKESRSEAAAALRNLDAEMKNLYGLTDSRSVSSNAKLPSRRVSYGGFGNSSRKFSKTGSKSGYSEADT